MLKNYLTVAWRTLTHNKTYALINVGGLAVAMAACLLIGLFVQQGLSFDDFHEKADRIFFVGKQSERFDSEALWSLEPQTSGVRLDERFTQVETVVHTTFPQDVAVKTGEARREDEAVYASVRFFEVFSFPLAQGHPTSALDGRIAEGELRPLRTGPSEESKLAL